MIDIIFEGALASEFRSFRATGIGSIADAICAIEANYEKFHRTIRDLAERGIQFIVKAGYQELGEDELSKPLSKKIRTIRIIALPSGAGGGAGKILAGVAILGLGIFGGGFLGAMAVNVMLLGGALILQGIMGLFGRVKDPESDEKEGKKSLIISSPSQTLREGSRIPRLYGRTKIGLYPISVRIRTFKLS
jgi:predicted phage tail protein